MRDNIAAYKGAVLEGKIEISKNMLLDNDPIEKISRYTGLSKDEIVPVYGCSRSSGMRFSNFLS